MTNVKLSCPVMIDGQAITEVTMSRVKVKHLKAVEKARQSGGDFDAAVALVSVLTGLPVEAVEDMEAGDFTKLSEVAESFLPSVSPRNGEQ